MRVIYTDTALIGLDNALDFLSPKVSPAQLEEIGEQILNKADSPASHPYQGQLEPYLEDQPKNCRRLVENHFKIVYYIQDETVYVIDIFDSRQHPDKMKSG